MVAPAVQAVEVLDQISHLPASMNGSPVLYATTLTAMMCGSLLGGYVVAWMGKDLIRDRKHAGFKSVLFNFRMMMMLCGLGAFAGCFPEALYLQMYNDPKIATETQATVLNMKRMVDSSRVYILIGWVGLLTMIYPYVSLALIEAADGDRIIKHMQVEDYPGLSRLWKPAAIFMLIAGIAVAFAFSKVYGS